MNTEPEDKTTIHVYRDHERWATCAKWFMLPDHLLKSLYVASYECNLYDAKLAREELETIHPNCVFIGPWPKG